MLSNNSLNWLQNYEKIVEIIRLKKEVQVISNGLFQNIYL